MGEKDLGPERFEFPNAPVNSLTNRLPKELLTRGYTGKGLGLQDLTEEGTLGLLRAVEGFDPDMGTRFSTYASYWIKQSKS